MKYADDFVLLVKEETMQQGMIDRVTKLEVVMGWKWMWEKVR